MNILMIDHFSPANAYTEELVKCLAPKENITVLSREDAKDFSNHAKQMKLLYGGRKNVNNRAVAIVKYLFGSCALMKAVRSPQYDIIHVQTFKNARIEIGIYKRKRKKTKLVHTVHNLLPHEPTKADKKIYSYFYDICDALIVHNEECRRQLIEIFGMRKEKVYVVPHGAYSVALPLKTEKVDNKIHYLMFGVIRQYKGLDVLLKAVSLIPECERTHMEFIIAGQQYLNQNSVDYNKMVHDLGIEDNVKLIIRRIEDDELPRIFGWADVCLFPYREIYGSGALLMAYSYQVPVIVSDVPAFVEETDFGKTGMIFKTEDAASLAKSIIAYAHLGEDEKESMRSQIRNLIESKYHWEVSASKTDDVYRSLME